MLQMNKASRARLLIISLAAVVAVGLVLLVARQQFNYGGLAFEILTYVLSVVALILAVLSVANGIRQGRIMNRIVRDVHEELKQMAALNLKLEQGIKEDQEVSKVISDILTKYGIDENERIHKRVQTRTHKRIKKHGL